MNEFDLIAKIKARTPESADVVLGIGDDAAVLQPSIGMQLVATTDNLVAGRHFVDSGDNRATAEEIGHLALAVNLSDLAAMGATPRWALLTLTLPEAEPRWLDDFLAGFLALAAEHGCALVGGNIAQGPLDIGVTALGEVPAGRSATRSGGRPGDRIVVTGTLGDAAAGLELQKPVGDWLRDRLLKPTPRVAAGRELAGRVNALIDISDGLLADLAHLTGDQGRALGAEIHCPRLPVSPALEQAVTDAPKRWTLQFAGGDYELLALWPGAEQPPAAVAGLALTEIGRVTDSGRIQCLGADGQNVATGESGWKHFR